MDCLPSRLFSISVNLFIIILSSCLFIMPVAQPVWLCPCDNKLNIKGNSVGIGNAIAFTRHQKWKTGAGSLYRYRKGSQTLWSCSGIHDRLADVLDISVQDPNDLPGNGYVGRIFAMVIECWCRDTAPAKFVFFARDNVKMVVAELSILSVDLIDHWPIVY